MAFTEANYNFNSETVQLHFIGALYCWLPVVVLASIVIFQVTLVSIKCLPSFCTQTGLHLDWTVRTVESNSFTVCYCVCSGMC